MAAYIIAWVEVHNTAWRDAYGPTTMAVIQKHGGKVLTGFGATMETLEGDKPLPSAIVVSSSRLWSTRKLSTMIRSTRR